MGMVPGSRSHVPCVHSLPLREGWVGDLQVHRLVAWTYQRMEEQEAFADACLAWNY
jgi:hypothetical protein